jgi:hypothetical protein
LAIKDYNVRRYLNLSLNFYTKLLRLQQSVILRLGVGIFGQKHTKLFESH